MINHRMRLCLLSICAVIIVYIGSYISLSIFGNWVRMWVSTDSRIGKIVGEYAEWYPCCVSGTMIIGAKTKPDLQSVAARQVDGVYVPEMEYSAPDGEVIQRENRGVLFYLFYPMLWLDRSVVHETQDVPVSLDEEH